MSKRREKPQPLDELEMFELLRAAYPERFKDDSDETYEAAQQFADELSGWEDIADLLGRVVMLSMPVESALTKRWSHALGEVQVNGNAINMVAYVTRPMVIPEASDDKAEG